MLKWLWGKNGWDGCWGMVLGCVVALGVFLAGAIGVVSTLVAEGVFENKSALSERGLPSHGVPVMEITLADGLELSEIDGGSKETKYPGNTVDIYDNGGVAKYGDVEMKGRGNGTWLQDKKPYQIKFDEKVDLFGMGRSRKWYLLANAFDDTYLRTEVAFYLKNMLEMKGVVEGEPVELYVDGEYRGLYYITRAMEISKDLMDLKNDLGVLVELDNIYGSGEEYYQTDIGDILTVKDAVLEEQVNIAMEDFVRNYNELRLAVKENNFSVVNELMDIESFAKYYLLSEFSVNPDAYWTSFYMYKDGVDDRIHADVGWDFDMAFGNRQWGNWMGEKFYSPTETMIRKQERILRYEDVWIDEEQFRASDILSTLVFDLMEMLEFQDEVKRVFQEKMMGREEELVRMVVGKTEEIGNAARVDGEKWKKNDFNTGLTTMIEWIMARYEYFEKIYGDDNTKSAEAI